MTLAALIDLLALALALGALWRLALRVASLIAPRGLDRVLAAAALVAAAAVIEALLLGTIGLGTSTIALLAASLLLAAVGEALLPRPAVAQRQELGAWWAGLGGPERALAGAVAGAGVAWSAWLLLEPALDVDSTQYHLPEVVTWIASGRPGSVREIIADFPVGSFPVTNQAALALSVVRYLMGSIVLAAGILAAVACRPARARTVALAVLWAAVAIGAVQLALGRDGVPGLWVPALGLAIGGAAAVLASSLRPRAGALRAGLAGLAALGVAALALYPGSFLRLYADAPAQVENPLVDTRASYSGLVAYFDDLPGFPNGDAPLYFAPNAIAPLAGGRLTHDLVRLPDGLGCSAVRRRTAAGWVVLRVVSSVNEDPPAARCLDEPEARIPLPGSGELQVFGSGGPA